MAKVSKWNNVVFDHYSDFPMEFWRWPNFQPIELACKGTGKLMIDADSMDKLQALRDLLGKPMHLNSAYRSPEHNKAVGGVKNSKHLKAIAYDCRMRNHDPHKFEAAARKVGFTSFGFYVDQNFMHIDTRKRAAKWGKPFPGQPVNIEAEPEQPANENAPPERRKRRGFRGFGRR